MNYSFHPDAERDVADAVDFYLEQAGPAVARRFLIKADRVARLLA